MKILLVGDSGVGKSCVVHRFVRNVFVPNSAYTFGFDCCKQEIEYENRRYVLQIWDTAGQERFRIITSSYYRGAHGVLIAYDTTKKESFQNVKSWYKEIKIHAPEYAKIVLIGNKSDLEAKKEIGSIHGNIQAETWGEFPFFSYH